MLAPLIVSLFLAAEPAATSTDEGPLVPAFVPRSLSIGTFINAPMVSPKLRLEWEGALIDQPRNMLLWKALLGTGAGVNPQSPMTAHFQHTIMAGFGFRSDRQVLHWGFQVTAGAVWYRAAYLPGSIYEFENRVLPCIEGRIQLGVRWHPHFRTALYFGYSSPFIFLRQYPGNTFVGGVDVGLVFDWR